MLVVMSLYVCLRKKSDVFVAVEEPEGMMNRQVPQRIDTSLREYSPYKGT